MNILSKVTHKTLMKNKVRTLVTVVGIILSAAMISAVTVSVASFQRYLQDVMAAIEGKWHAAVFAMTPEDAGALLSDGRVDSAALAQVSGAQVPQEEGEDSHVLILSGDSAFFERMPVRLTEGRLPENPGEIVLATIMLGDQRTQIGDAVTITTGNFTADGKVVGGGVRGDTELEFTPTGERTYTVVGYIDWPDFAGSSFTDTVGISRYDSADTVSRVNAYALLTDPKDTYQLQRDWQDEYVSDDNSNYLMALGVSRYDTFNTVLYSFAAILIGLIMFGSVSLIYNAFSISVAQRTKQFGLLRSVGATKRQIRSMVFTEALTVSAVGIPLGILSGVLGMAVTFHFIGQSLGSILSNTIGARTNLALTVHAAPWAIVAAALIGLVTVLISAWVPSRRAMRVSAIEAIRQSGDVKIKPREVRTGKLTYRLFGLEGAIASKHFKRNRKGYRATVVSLFMSVVLFISASSFCRYLTDAVSTAFQGYDYDIRWEGFRFLSPEGSDGSKRYGSDDLSGLVAALSGAKSVTGIAAAKYVDCKTYELRESDVPEGTWARLKETYATDPPAPSTIVRIFGVEDATYRAYLKANGLSEEEYMGEDPKIIVRAVEQFFNRDTGRVERYELLREDVKSLTFRIYDEIAASDYQNSDEYQSLTTEEKMQLEMDFSVPHTYEIGFMTDELLLGLNNLDQYSGITVLMPLGEAQRIARSIYDQTEISFTVSDHENGLQNILSAASAAGYTLDEYDFRDIYRNAAPQRSLIAIIRVISYGFITLISLIAALNVFNTISTNILLRRREFAMLRSVGMTDRGFDRMMNFECLLYGAKALLFGIPAAFGVTYLIFRSVQAGMDTDFYLPWTAVAIAVCSVFLVVFASMLWSMSGIKKDNPIEAMKNEVI